MYSFSLTRYNNQMAKRKKHDFQKEGAMLFRI